tara:strand:+ start:479 stop:811 length:333 start_codon:yes stop_codon:yes gene_type:complete
MQWLLIVLYVAVCLLLIGVVLLQRGKDSSGDLFGAGASSVLSSQGTTSFLVKLTGTLSLLFFILSFSLGVMINQSTERVRLADVLKAKEEVSVESASAQSSAPATQGLPK